MTLSIIRKEIVNCRKCNRLVFFREKIAKEKRKSYIDWEYWGKGVPGFGKPNSKLLILGLAPAAHGANRTGRVFTGDKSADFLFKCLYHVGLSNQPNSDHLNDGLVLSGYMTPILKCVPPGDKPTAEEILNCSDFLKKELKFLPNLKIIVGLGKIAFDTYLKHVKSIHPIKMKDYKFIHSVGYNLPNGIKLYGCYHPSPRNVNTKRLDFNMMITFLRNLKEEL